MRMMCHARQFDLDCGKAAMYGVRTNTVHVWVQDLREAGECIKVVSRKRSGLKRQQD